MTVIVSSFRQIEQGAHYIGKILDLLEDSVSGACSSRLVYKFDEKSYSQIFENVNRSLKYDSNFFVHKHIHGHQHRSLYPALAAHAGVNI